MPEETTQETNQETPQTQGEQTPEPGKSDGDSPFDLNIPDAEEFIPTKFNRGEDPEAEDDDDEGVEDTPESIEEDDDEPKKEAKPVDEKEEKKEGEEKPQVFTVKINGEEKNVTLEQLTEKYQRESSADAKFQEAAKVRKQAQSIVEALRTDPLAVLRHKALGIDPAALRKMMEKALYEEIQYEQMTPEQREAIDNKRRLETIEAENKALAAQQERQKADELQKQYSDQYNQEIIQALDKSTLPKTPYTVKRMAYYMSQALNQYYKKTADIPPEQRPPMKMPMDQIVEIVQKDYQGDLTNMLSSMDPEKLYATLGKDTVEKIRKQEIAKLKGTGTTPAKQGQAPRKGKKSKKIPISDWKARNRAILEGTN